jgi:hypothetical protein
MDPDRLAAGLELLGSQTDVGVTPEAAREHARSLHRWCVVEPLHGEEWTYRNAPAPAVPTRVVLRIADDLDHGEDRLPSRGIADRKIALLQARPSGRRVRAQRALLDTLGQGTITGSPNQQPVLQHRPFLTSRQYPLRIRRYLSLGLVLAAVVVASGCGDSDQESSPPAAEPTTTQTTTSGTTNGIDPLEGAGTAPVVAQTAAKDIVLLERVAVGRHEGFDRVVFQFRGEDLPGYRVEYVEPPLKEDGSGNLVRLEGNAFVLVRIEPASGFDLNTGEGVIVYKGPKRLEGSASGTSTVVELVRTGDFEAVLSWAVGLQDRVDFRVLRASSPTRLIVDFRNH